MAGPSKGVGSGFRHTQVFALDPATGLLLAASAGATAYDGVTIDLARSLTLTAPEPQIIQHPGDDRIGQLYLLPPTEAISATLTTGKMNLTLDALLGNLNVVTLGDMKLMLAGTEQQGSEPQVALLGYRQALDADPASGTFGQRVWQWLLFPSARLFAGMGSMEAGGDDEHTYTVQPSVVKKYTWGIAFADGTEGATEGQIVRGISRGKPKMCAWLIDAVPTLVLDLPENAKADEAGTSFAIKVFLYHAGAASDITAACTLAADTVTVVGAVEDDIVTAFYELA